MPISLYIHIPFCQRKCPYCDFNTYAGLEGLFERFCEALQTEIAAAGATWSRPAVATIFVGGGTPTVLPAAMLAAILATCARAFRIEADAEVTCEANPGAVDASRFAALRQAGVNRLSLGVQSFDDRELRFLGRIHDAGQAEAALAAARAAGFDNVNLDLIYGLPNQALDSWRQSLQRALALRPQHLSLYALTIEEGTPFAGWAAGGRFPYPDPDLAADQYELADELLTAAGYVQYEISNWALTDRSHRLAPDANPRFACRHNLTYWRNETYLGFGPGAHSSAGGRRWANLRAVPAYIDRLREDVRPAAGREDGPAVDWQELIDDRLAMGETMMLGLRLTREGVPVAGFAQKHSRPLQEVFGAEVDALNAMGLLEHRPDRVRLTKSARLVANQVFARFLP